MAERPSHTWTCPSCGRRVPLRIEACHCGATRAQAEEMAAEAPAAPRPREPVAATRLPPLPTDVKILVVGALAVLVVGSFWLVLAPSPPPAAPAILGYVDVGPPRPSPPPRPPFELPWWK